MMCHRGPGRQLPGAGRHMMNVSLARTDAYTKRYSSQRTRP